MTSTSRSSGLLVGVASVFLLASSTGCSMSKLIANQTASMIQAGSPAFEALNDYELAGIGIPGAIVQLETFYYITPDNADLGINLAKAYTGYSLGWVEPAWEALNIEGKEEEAEVQRTRARNLYLRARDIAVHQLNVKKKGIEEALKDEAALDKYLKKLKSKKDAPALFWAGSSWGAAIDMSRDRPDLIMELPIAKA